MTPCACIWIPQVILSDCGSQFLSETFKGVCKLFGIKRIQSTSFRPQSNGSNERSHKSLIEYLRSYVAADLSNRDQWVKYATVVHYTTPHSATSYMLFQLLFGLPNLPGVLQRQPPSAFYAYDTYVKELEAMLQGRYAMARKNLETSKMDNKRHYDRYGHVPQFKIGDQVLVKDESVRRGRSKKLEAPYNGPYEIIEIEEPNLIVRTKRSKELTIHANRAKLLFASLQMWTVLAWLLLCVINASQGIDFRNEPVQSSPSLYYQCEGTARLYTSEWKVVTYINLSAREICHREIYRLHCSILYKTQ
jgi:hypothetical protein